jgi:hypothetical protein
MLQSPKKEPGAALKKYAAPSYWLAVLNKKQFIKLKNAVPGCFLKVAHIYVLHV